MILAALVLDSPHAWPLALGGAAVLILSVVLLYLPQVGALAQPWRWLLPALRCGGMVALAVSILKPVAVRPASQSEAGAILLLVDRSMSMSVRDLAYLAKPADSGPGPNPAAARLVSLADAMGLFPRPVRQATLVALQADLQRTRGLLADLSRAQAELDFARVSGRDLDAAKSRLSTAWAQFRSAALQVADRSADFPRPPRAAEAGALLLRMARGSDERIPQAASSAISSLLAWSDDAQAAADLALYQSDPSVRDVCNKLAAMSRFARVEMALTSPSTGLLGKLPSDVPLFGYALADDIQPLPLRGGGQPVRRLLAQPDGLRSDLTGGLRQAIARLAGQPLQAIVIFSDGRQVGGDPDMVSAITAAGVPIFFVYCAGTLDLPLRDVAIAGMSVPDSAFVGETVTARVRVAATEMAGSVAPVSVSTDGRAPTTRPTALADDPVTVEFPVKFDDPGVHRLLASVPCPSNAPTDQNKSLQRWVKVMADKVNIGIYSGAAGWDFQYVLNALSRAPWANLSKGIFSTPNAALDLTPEKILQQDLLILFDVPISALSRPQWEAVHTLVNDRGGRVILVAGDAHLPAEYSQDPLTAALLPWTGGAPKMWRDWPGREAGFHAQPARGARDLDALRLRDGTADVSEDWAQLPAFFRFLSLPPLKPAARALLVERDSGAPLLVENRVGMGRTWFLAMDETWRWRFKVGERYQDRFWLQLVRYAADAPYAAHSGNVWLDADPIAAAPSQPIKVRAKVLDERQNPSQEPTQRVQLCKSDAVIRDLTLTVASGVAGRYEGTIDGLPEGDYQLHLSAGAAPPATLPLHIAPDISAEMAIISGSEQPLRRLAESTGGALLTLEQIGTLPGKIDRGRTAQNRILQNPLWDSFYLYTLVVACFAAEWAIRKHVGLI
jgi:hypothetical protein